MCIAVISTAHPDYSLILISNRDEYLSRPTKPAGWWDPPNEQVLGGRDLLRSVQGTWLGLTKDGRVAVLTNFRDVDQPSQGLISRGAIPNAFLTQQPHAVLSTKEFAASMVTEDKVRGAGGFSLIFGKCGEELAVVSNRTPNTDSIPWIAKEPGQTVGLSNAAFGDRSWPKVIDGERLMAEAIGKSVKYGYTEDQLFEELIGVLNNSTLPQRKENEAWVSYVNELRNSIFIPQIGGETLENEHQDRISTGTSDELVYVDGAMSGVYGTQKQSVLLVDHKGRVKFIERTLYEDSSKNGSSDGHRDRVFEFDIRSED